MLIFAAAYLTAGGYLLVTLGRRGQLPEARYPRGRWLTIPVMLAGGVAAILDERMDTRLTVMMAVSAALFVIVALVPRDDRRHTVRVYLAVVAMMSGMIAIRTQ